MWKKLAQINLTSGFFVYSLWVESLSSYYNIAILIIKCCYVVRLLRLCCLFHSLNQCTNKVK